MLELAIVREAPPAPSMARDTVAALCLGSSGTLVSDEADEQNELTSTIPDVPAFNSGVLLKRTAYEQEDRRLISSQNVLTPTTGPCLRSVLCAIYVSEEERISALRKDRPNVETNGTLMGATATA